LLRALAEKMDFKRPPARVLANIVRSIGFEHLADPAAAGGALRWRRTEGLRHSKTATPRRSPPLRRLEHVLRVGVGPVDDLHLQVPAPRRLAEEAQENKYRLVFEKLRLKPGDRLLDVGCGWGGMVRYAARHGVKAIGVTLSKEQAEWAQNAIAEQGLADLGEVRHGDYRDVPESGFDAVSSIGLTEHIGVHNYPSYFGFLKSKMRTGALLLNHCITRHDNRAGAPAGGFIDRYVFPDGELTGSGRIITEAQDVGLEVVHEENLRHHYALTLRDWCRNLVEHWDEAVEEVGLPTAKVWGLYMAGSRLGFETNVVQLHQVLAVNLDADGNDGGLPLRPWWNP
jgi:cyclopropane-fatty-acyl-phospholipid synthase